LKNLVFSVLGGDDRHLMLFDMLCADGYEVIGYNLPRKQNTISDLNKIIAVSDIIILPLPVTKDGRTLHGSPKTDLCTLFSLCENKAVFAGKVSRDIVKLSKDKNITLIDYFASESMNIMNSIPTAEGALEIAMNNTDFTIFESRCLVAGYGRIGKILASYLSCLGADVFVAARKESDFSYIRTHRYTPVSFKNLSECVQDMDIIFNTVPAIVFDKAVLSNIKPKTLLIDLASTPGGVDYNTAKQLDINVISALSLPGKAAPRTAAKIIKDTIISMI